MKLNNIGMLPPVLQKCTLSHPRPNLMLNFGIFHGELVFDVEPHSHFCERCHLNTNYVVIAVISLEEGVNLPFVCCKKKCQPGQVGHNLFCFKTAQCACL